MPGIQGHLSEDVQEVVNSVGQALWREVWAAEVSLGVT